MIEPRLLSIPNYSLGRQYYILFSKPVSCTTSVFITAAIITSVIRNSVLILQNYHCTITIYLAIIMAENVCAENALTDVLI